MLITSLFLLKIRVRPGLVTNKTAGSGERVVALERPQRGEQVIPRRQHPPSPLFGSKSTEKGPKDSFDQQLRTAPIILGLMI